MIQSTRLHFLNQREISRGSYVMYWMQQAQRVEHNHALYHAVSESNRLKLPLLIVLVLTPNFPEANARHYHFMLEGLKELFDSLKKKHLPFFIFPGEPVEILTMLAGKASLLITDRGYLKIQREWRQKIAEQVDCRMIEVETDAILPVEQVSDHEEYAARTIRPKILRLLKDYLVREEIPEYENINHDCSDLIKKSISPTTLKDLSQLSIREYPGAVSTIHGGSSQAEDKLRTFIEERLQFYPEKRNEPSLSITSGLSPYLHFGQISALHIALEVLDSDASSEIKWSFLEELIVRRELSLNFCRFNDIYDSFECLPGWARKTLLGHALDKREVTYSYEQLENADTDDSYWNAAQKEVMITGQMHNYMRMYWGKKILSWIPDPVNAFEFTLYLNNKYAIDGRDPNSFAGVAWCFGKHDRPWNSNPVFGNVRMMTSSGLKRKFNMAAYLDKISRL